MRITCKHFVWITECSYGKTFGHYYRHRCVRRVVWKPRSFTKVPVECTLKYYTRTHARARGEIISLKETEMLIRTKRKSIAELANVRDKKMKANTVRVRRSDRSRSAFKFLI